MSLIHRCQGESDVYVFQHVDGFISCCGCSFLPSYVQGVKPDAFETRLQTVPELIEHLKAHREHGDLVPDDLLEAAYYDDVEVW
jgi:hypothetical protein